MLEVPIRGEKGSISIKILRYSYPAATDYWDGNWLAGIVTVLVPGFKAELDLYLRTEDFVQFLDQLEKIMEPRAGKASFETMEKQIDFVIEMARQGTCNIEGQISDHIPGGDLRFSFDTDQSYLAETLRNMRAVVQEFPVRGSAK